VKKALSNLSGSSSKAHLRFSSTLNPFRHSTCFTATLTILAMDSFTQLPASASSMEDVELYALVSNFDSETESQCPVDEERHGGGIAAAFCVIA